MNKSTARTGLLAAIVLMAGQTASASDGWQWSLEPYLQASNIEGDASIGRVVGANVSLDTSDILEKLEIGAMIHAEALHDSGWGVMVDYAFMRLGDDLSGPLGGVVDMTLRQGVLEALAFRRTTRPTTISTVESVGGTTISTSL